MVELLVKHILRLADFRPVFQKNLFPANLPHGKRSCVPVDLDSQFVTWIQFFSSQKLLVDCVWQS